MSIEANKMIVRRLYDAVNTQDLASGSAKETFEGFE